jgi:hypothetical protein
MPSFSFRILGLLALATTLPLEAQVSPALSGIVTDVGTPAAFAVNGRQVHCTAKTQSTLVTPSQHTPLVPCPARTLGESLVVYGKRDANLDAIVASIIESEPIGEGKPEGNVEGFAVIDRIIRASDASGATMVSADGYAIEIPAAIHAVFQPPLRADTKITTNLWIRYSGLQHPDGSITATGVTLSQNLLKAREINANTKREFDPASVTEENRQGGWSKAFRGLDAKRIPASRNRMMQERVERIGNSLIPAYQRDLAADDPTKIDFRFQVVDWAKRHDAMTLSNGIVLIPEQLVARLESDAQLATVLADNIACALEKQDLRAIPARRALLASDVSLYAGGAVVPGLGLAPVLTDGVAKTQMQRHAEEQSGRVSLMLLRQAGYDITEAPKVWWMLASLNPKPVTEISMPYRARYLYHILATTWRTAPAIPADSSAVASQSTANSH